MNDFTKKELQTIDYLIDAYCINSIPPEGIYALLKTKIQMMIESHCFQECNHEWVSLFTIDEINLRVLGEMGYKCLLCNKLIYDKWSNDRKNWK